MFYTNRVVCNIIAIGLSEVNTDWSWRTVTLIQAFPSIIQIGFIWCKPAGQRAE